MELYYISLNNKTPTLCVLRSDGATGQTDRPKRSKRSKCVPAKFLANCVRISSGWSKRKENSKSCVRRLLVVWSVWKSSLFQQSKHPQAKLKTRLDFKYRKTRKTSKFQAPRPEITRRYRVLKNFSITRHPQQKQQSFDQ